MEERLFHVRRYLQCRNVRSIGSSWFRFARHAVVPSDLSGRPHHRVETASWGAGRENPEAAGRAAPRARLRGHADRLLIVKPPRRIYLPRGRVQKVFRTVHKLSCFLPTRPGFFCPFCLDKSFVDPAESDSWRFRQRNAPPGRNSGEKRPGITELFLLCMAHPLRDQRCNCLTSKERRLYAELSFGAPVGFFHHCCVIDAEKGDRWLHVALDSNFGSLTRYAATIGHDPQPAGTIIELIDSFT